MTSDGERRTVRDDDGRALRLLEERLKTLLPELYQDDHEVKPVSMGSAGLKFNSEGRVAWDEIWGSFCDLAMAGGPPHKGRLLGPGYAAEIAAAPSQYRAVFDEIRRGIGMVTGLGVELSAASGWIRVQCRQPVTAGWLARAITMENVAVRVANASLDLPIAPGWRIEKEIKNVITVIAKTYHYWDGHTSPRQQEVVAELLAAMEVEGSLLQPALAGEESDETHLRRVAAAIYYETGFAPVQVRYPGWLGIACPDVSAAVWMMRALVASNVLARREETALYVPIDPGADPSGGRVAEAVGRVHRLLRVRQTTSPTEPRR